MRRVATAIVAAALAGIDMTAGVKAEVGQTRAAGHGTYAGAVASWDAGDYEPALRQLRAIAAEAEGAAFDEIALLTGELFETREITPDARVASFAGPDGNVLFETGPATAPVVRLVTRDARPLTGFDGARPVADASGRRIAYASPEGTLAWRDSAGGAPAAVTAPGFVVTSYAWSEDGALLFYSGGSATAQDVFAYDTAAGASRRLTDTPAPEGAVRVVPGGAGLLYTIPARRSGPGGTPAIHGWIDLQSGETGTFENAATAPAVSADGRTLAYIVRDGAIAQLMLQPWRDEPMVIVATRDRLDAPALSPDGSRVAYQRMPEQDWELFVSDRRGESTVRVTREIQHDVLPRFLSNDRLLAMMGERRHRRAHVYDLTAGTRTRVFHNNTVRTIAPEYAWEPDPAGRALLVTADRDGDTISPARGLYVVDLTSRVSRASLLSRLDAMLAAEQGLAAFAARVTRPLAAAIRAVVDRASVSRIFGYQRALFAFDSKHISAPGNAKAAEYLHATYASFGYAPSYQWFAPPGALGGRSANVVAVLKGTTSPDVIYVVGSHYDTEVGVAGADDNASGTAALLEVARLLAGRPQPATIVFASFTGEEEGALGAEEFVRLAREARWHVAGALNNDMVGWTNDHRLDNTIRYSSDAIRDIQHAVAMTFTRLVTYDARYYRGTDAEAFYEAWGNILGGIGSYPVLGSPHYHQPHDSLEHVNHQLVTEVAKTTAATLMVLANRPAPPRGLVASRSGRGVVLTWEPAAERDVRQYAVAWQTAAGAERRVVVTAPRATLASVPPGTSVRVTALNRRGLEGWDHARVVVP